jgi:hypothetical protein
VTISRAQALSVHPDNATTGSTLLNGAPKEAALLVAVVCCMAEGAQRNTTAFSDDVNGDWTQVPDAALFSFSGWLGEVSIWYYVNSTANAKVPTVTAEFDGNVASNCMSIVEYIGVPMQITYDVSAAADSDDGTGHTTTGALTTQTDLLIGGFGDFGTESVYTAGTDWTKVTAFEDSSNIQCMIQDQGVGTTGMAADTYTADCTTDIDTTVGAVFAAFQVSTGPPVAGEPLYRVVESGGAYHARPGGSGYVDFLGSVDPGVDLLPGDSWTRTPAAPS